MRLPPGCNPVRPESPSEKLQRLSEEKLREHAEAQRQEQLNPSYYQRGIVQVIDFIKSQNLSFDCGNVVKYICRAGYKGDRLLDLEKALEYLQHEIEWERKSRE